MKIMILGITGLIGQALFKELQLKHEIIGLSRKKQEADENLTFVSFDIEKNSILPILEEHKPDLLISCVRGSFDKQLEVHKNIVNFAKDNKILIDFYSTANVFDGCADSIKYEDDKTCPESEYGLYKVKVEKLVKSLKGWGRILRLPMVFGEHSPRVNQIKSAIKSKDSIDVYGKCYLSIVIDRHVAKLHHQIINENLRGIFHLSSSGVKSQKEIYTEIIGSEAQLNVLPLEVYYLAIQSKRAFINNYKMDDEIKQLNTYIGELHG